MMWVSDHAAMFEIDAKVKNDDDFMIQLKMLQASIKRKLGKWSIIYMSIMLWVYFMSVITMGYYIDIKTIDKLLKSKPC